MSRSRSRTTTETGKSSARRGAASPFEPGSVDWSNPDSASTATDDPKGSGVPPATESGSERSLSTEERIDAWLPHISEQTPTSDASGSSTIASESAGTSPTSPNSGGRSRTLNRRWRTPRDAREWAAQLNSIATGVLNGTIDLEEAKVVSSISRSAAQLLTAEVQRARFLQIEPDLSLEFDESPEKSPETPNSPE